MDKCVILLHGITQVINAKNSKIQPQVVCKPSNSFAKGKNSDNNFYQKISIPIELQIQQGWDKSEGRLDFS